LEAAYSLKRGKTIVFWGFTSTTTNMEALDAFIPDDSAQRTLFSISAGLAADLGPYSAFPEAEVLMPAGNVFEVLNVKRFSRFGLHGFLLLLKEVWLGQHVYCISVAGWVY
jgi:hypothetical protein